MLTRMLQGLEDKVTVKIEDVGRELRPAIQTLQATVTAHAESISTFETSDTALEARVAIVVSPGAGLSPSGRCARGALCG